MAREARCNPIRQSDGAKRANLKTLRRCRKRALPDKPLVGSGRVFMCFTGYLKVSGMLHGGLSRFISRVFNSNSCLDSSTAGRTGSWNSSCFFLNGFLTRSPKQRFRNSVLSQEMGAVQPKCCATQNQARRNGALNWF